MERQRLNGEASNQLNAPYEFNVQELQNLSTYLREKVFEICVRSGSGHIGGSSSSVELITSLYFGGILNYDPKDLRHPDRDRVLVRGHLGPLRYPILALLGEVNEEELVTYREFGSRLQGHEEHQQLPGVDLTPSGSLGMLLSYGVGSAVASKDSGRNYKTYVFLGDGEEQEGNVSEAARHAAHLKLDNLIVILDKNGKQLSDPTSQTDSADVIKTWSGYGWNTLEIKDGHNINEIIDALNQAKETKGPIFVVANTIKGYGLEGANEHFSGYHTIRTCPPEIAKQAISQLKHQIQIDRDINEMLLSKIKTKESDEITVIRPENNFSEINLDIQPTPTTSRNLNAAQGEYFVRLGQELKNRFKELPPIYFLTADVVRQDDVENAKLRDFASFLNVGIREQHMIAMSHGLSLSLPEARIIISSFDAFSYRSIDQLNSLSLGDGSVVIIGDIAGITNSKNGATHQAASQPGAILGIPNVTLLEPADVNDLFNCLNWSIGKSRGPIYIRIHNSKTEDLLFSSDRDYETNKLKYYKVKPANEVNLSIVASGLAVGHSVLAAKILDEYGINTQVVNVINQKSLDANFTRLLPAGKPVLTVYNGEPSILQNSVARAIFEFGESNFPSRIIGHGFQIGTSGSLEDLMKHYQLDPQGIANIAISRLFQK
ncbi:MAG: 1-deoxy-D-xylulose-5-phosphate synthase N-terminal domain-containing protein [Patescibacteria group bacterium]